MPEPTPETFLASFPSPVRDLAERLADIIQQTVPEATSAVKLGWACLGFTHPVVGYFCGVFPSTDHVKIGFEFGVLLSDPEGHLTGSGTQLRYLEVPLHAAPPTNAIVALLHQAVALPPENAIRRAMVRDR